MKVPGICYQHTDRRVPGLWRIAFGYRWLFSIIPELQLVKSGELADQDSRDAYFTERIRDLFTEQGYEPRSVSFYGTTIRMTLTDNDMLTFTLANPFNLEFVLI